MPNGSASPRTATVKTPTNLASGFISSHDVELCGNHGKNCTIALMNVTLFNCTHSELEDFKYFQESIQIFYSTIRKFFHD
jgi:hypothetical protein